MGGRLGKTRHYPKDMRAWEESPSRKGVSGVLSMPAQAEGGPPSDLKIVRFPPEFFPPPGSRYIYGEGRATIAGPNTTTVIAGLTVQVPRNAVGVIREINLNINDMLVTTDVRWRFTLSGQLVQGYDLTLFPRLAASVSASFSPESVSIPFPDGALIQFPITVVDAGSYLVGASYRGWFFSKQTAKEYGYVGYFA